MELKFYHLLYLHLLLAICLTENSRCGSSSQNPNPIASLNFGPLFRKIARERGLQDLISGGADALLKDKRKYDKDQEQRYRIKQNQKLHTPKPILRPQESDMDYITVADKRAAPPERPKSAHAQVKKSPQQSPVAPPPAPSSESVGRRNSIIDMASQSLREDDICKVM